MDYMDWNEKKNVKTTEETITTENNIIENVIHVGLKEDDVETTETPDSTIKHSAERTCQ
jgi:hypothetical protein